MAVAEPLRLLSVHRLAAGNRLCRRPCLAVRIDTAADASGDPDAVAHLLANLAPDLEDEFRLARVAGAAGGPAPAFAAVMAALMANGYDLAARVEPAPPAARPAWWVLVEMGFEGPFDQVPALAADLLLAAMAGAPAGPALRARVEAICGTGLHRYGRSQRNLLVRALEARGIGWRAGPEAAVGAAGEGRWRVRLNNSITDRTMMPGAAAAERKDVASALLARLGLPVARQRPAADRDAACAAAAAIGYPVVVKPVDRSNGRGITVDLTTPEAVAAAFERARRGSSRIVVEAQLPGTAHRFLVVRGRLVAALANRRGRLVGDGVRTVRELVAEANRVPSRQRPRPLGQEIRFTTDILDHLARHGHDPETVPARDEAVDLHWHAHMARGGVPVAIAGPIHPDNVRAACQAAAVIGLDVAGIDLHLPDIARSWRETGGGICEINRAPGFRTHVIAEGRDGTVLPRYLDHLVGPGPRTVPILVFLGGEEMDGPAMQAARMLQARGLGIGLAAATRFEAAGLPLADPGVGHPLRLVRLVDDPSVEAVVARVPPAAILERGFGHDRACLAILGDPPAPDAHGAAAILAATGADTVTADALADGSLLDRIVARHRRGAGAGDSRVADVTPLRAGPPSAHDTGG